jgi:glycogen operon protein
MTQRDWADPNARSVAVYLDGADDPDRADDGRRLIDDDFLVLVNAWWRPLDFTIPPSNPNQTWYPELDSFDPSSSASSGKLGPGDRRTVGPRSVVLLRGPRSGK